MAIRGQRFQLAINDFHRARHQAAMQRIGARLTGKSVALLSYDDVAEQLGVTGRIDRGLKQIPVNAIVGSVGRYSDFTRTFLPRRISDAERWARVKSAADHISMLPPIDVYQIGEAYFVLDGNHRVSIARTQGIDYIDAHVVEVKTRVPLSPDDQPDELILKAEYADFLKHTGLDQHRPGADLAVSVPGQFRTLENHIEVHRYFVEDAEGVELTNEEAAVRWYDEAYLPMVEAVREQGILRYFPGRTETDFYVWIAKNRAALQNELGWQIRPETAVARLSSDIKPVARPFISRLGKRIRDVVVTNHHQGNGRPEQWSQEKVLDRYSHRLFAEILVPVGEPGFGWPALEHALIAAKNEGAQLFGLHVPDAAIELSPEEAEALYNEFARRCDEAGVAGSLAIEAGDCYEKIAERAVLADLVIVDRSFLGLDTNGDELAPKVVSLLTRCVRPVLIAGDITPRLERVLLAYDGGDKSKEAMFVAAYLAEEQKADLQVVTAHEGKKVDESTMAHARAYLELHEMALTCTCQSGTPADLILDTGRAQNSDLIVMGISGAGLAARGSLGRTVKRVIMEWQRSLLLCP